MAVLAVPVTVPPSPVKPEIESQELPKPSGDERLIGRSRGLLGTLLFHSRGDTCFSGSPYPREPSAPASSALLGSRANQRCRRLVLVLHGPVTGQPKWGR